MTKVNYKYTTTEAFFDSFLSGNYFIYRDRLYLKVSDHSAFDFDQGIFISFAQPTPVLLKDKNGIEITVK